jgi:alkylation response protein AidB-like acyl-CoA dehydrogenase
MDFALSEEQQMFRELFSDFAEKEIAPLAEHTDSAEAPPVEMLRKAAAQGFLGSTLPEQYGGAGMDYVTYALLLEAVGRRCLSTAVTISIHTMLAAMTIVDGGTEAQKEYYLPRLAGGELGAFALTEPEAGSDPASLQTRAVREAGHYRLDGVKTWVSNAGLAGAVVALAATDPAAHHRGITAFILDMAPDARTAGLTFGEREPTLGMRGVDIRTLYLDDARVPAESVLGPENGGWPLAMAALQRVRLSLAAAALGAAEGALDLGVKYAIERRQFGGPLAHKQAIQAYVGDCAVEIEALRGLVFQAAWLADTGQDFSRAASQAKLFGARVARDTANKMLQVHGGYGFSDEYPISRIYRDVRALRVLGGTDEIQRLSVARRVFADNGLRVSF